VGRFQETFKARVYALIEHDPHGVTGRRAIRSNALGPRREGL
jgi:phage head maturation protease